MFDKEQDCFVMSHVFDINIRVVSFPNEHIFTLQSDDTNSF